MANTRPKVTQLQNLDNQSTKRIYLLCSESGATLCATTRLRRLREAVEHQVHAKKMFYGNDGPMPVPDQIRALREDWKRSCVEDIDTALKGGAIVVAENGRLINNP